MTLRLDEDTVADVFTAACDALCRTAGDGIKHTRCRTRRPRARSSEARRVAWALFDAIGIGPANEATADEPLPLVVELPRPVLARLAVDAATLDRDVPALARSILTGYASIGDDNEHELEDEA